MAKAIIGIGIPGSGKTTVLKKFAEKNSYTYISLDEIRKELTGDESDQTKNAEVWREVYKKSADFLCDGQTVVIDATFAKDFERKAFIKFIRESGAEKIQGIFMDTPIEIAQHRNKLRDRTVPHYAMERMSKNIKNFPPEIGEGFDSLFALNENAELIKAEVDEGENVISKEFKIK